jgi:hypothetical protein
VRLWVAEVRPELVAVTVYAPLALKLSAVRSKLATPFTAATVRVFE